MRFRAKSSRPQTSFLISLLPPCSNLSKDRTSTSTLLLSPTTLSLTTSPAVGQLSAHASVAMRSVFADFRIDSASENNILLSIDPTDLVTALRSLHASNAVQIQIK